VTEPFSSIIRNMRMQAMHRGFDRAGAAPQDGQTMSDESQTPQVRDQSAAGTPLPATQSAGPGGSTQVVARQPGAGVHGPVGRPMEGEVLPPKRGRRRVALPLILLAVAGGGGYFGYGWWTEGRFLVSTDDAYVKADVTTVATKVAGYVAAVPVTNNTTVKAGDVIVRIDDGDYRNAVDQAKAKIATQEATIDRIHRQVDAQIAALGQTRAQLVASQADQTRAEADFQRAQSLAQRDFGSKQTLDQTRADKERTAANVESAKAAIDSAQATIEVTRAQETEARKVLGELQTSLAKAERDLAFTIVTAPVAGVVANRAAEVGNYVQPGTRVAALVPLDTVYVEANFKETQLARLKPGQVVDIEVDALPGRKLEGTVQSFAPGSGTIFSLLPPENATGNFTKIVQRVPIRVAVPAEAAQSGALRPGLSVTATVRTRSEAEAVNDPVRKAVASLRAMIGLTDEAKARPRAAQATAD
jgi:membrane fusion protein (multidrug efflux system)